ncbi:MAG: extracellular solute-binding protein [Clostridia bacterium]|nr:extracellular solute-binding protein [Clostridia bacterium]
MRAKKTIAMLLAVALTGGTASGLVGCGDLLGDSSGSSGGKQSSESGVWNEEDYSSWLEEILGGSSSESSSEAESSFESESSSEIESSWGSESSAYDSSSQDSSSSESGGESIDATKTMLQVYFYDAGYGETWIRELAQRFEEVYQDVSFEEGKKGVQVIISGDMRTRTAEAWRAETYDVMFLESPSEFYQMMRDGVVENLDSIMKTPNVEDNNQTIEEKMTEQQKAAYTYDGHYYGIPHYAGGYGIVYNKDLFDEFNLYLAAEPDEYGYILITENNPVKSVGPDGAYGTEDDGLPRTYDEFFNLCIEINASGIDPICWPGMYKEQHLINFLDTLAANHEGAEQMNLNYTFNGVAENLIQFDEYGDIIYDFDENDNFVPVTESLQITDENGYELARQEGKYYAMQFLERLLTETDHYNEKDGLTYSCSHLEMQQKFLENRVYGYRENAMLIDGVWWQTEAAAVFDHMSRAHGEEYSAENRQFGWMPLPQATEAEAQKVANGEKKSVYNDYLRAVACVKKGLPDNRKIAALEFLKFAYTDEELANFTYATNTTIGVDYLETIDRERLTPYGNSLIDYIEKSDTLYHVSDNVFYTSCVNMFGNAWNVYGSYNYHGNIINAILDYNVSADEYFVGHRDYFRSLAWA